MNIPSHVEVPTPGSADQVSFELLACGHRCKVIQFGGHDHYVCFNVQWRSQEQTIHYVYGSEDGHDPDLMFLHTSTHGPLSTKDHMKLLHQRGCPKAAILEDTAVWDNVRRVVFICHKPELPSVMTVRTSTPWPDRQPVASRQDRPFCASSFPSQPSTSCISLGCTLQELESFSIVAMRLCAQTWIHRTCQRPHKERFCIVGRSTELIALSSLPMALQSEAYDINLRS